MLYLEHLTLTKSGIVFKDKMGRSLSLTVAVKKITNRFYNYLLDIELLIVRVTGFIPIFFIRKLIYQAAGVKIGRKTHIHMGTQFFYPAGVSIGNGTIIGQNAFLDGREKLKIGDHVDIASDVLIYNSEHDVHSADFAPVSAPVYIEDYAFIGPRAIILPGVTLKKGAVVAAGAVVTSDVEQYQIVGGVPAKMIGWRKVKDLNYVLGRARLFQ